MSPEIDASSDSNSNYFVGLERRKNIVAFLLIIIALLVPIYRVFPRIIEHHPMTRRLSIGLLYYSITIQSILSSTNLLLFILYDVIVSFAVCVSLSICDTLLTMAGD